MLLRPGRSSQGDSAIVHELSNVEAFDYDLQSLLLIRSLGYLKRVLDHMNLCALGILGRVVPPRLSAFLDREYELVFRVKFPKILLHGAESQRSRWGRVHGGFRWMPKSTGLFQRWWAGPRLYPALQNRATISHRSPPRRRMLVLFASLRRARRFRHGPVRAQMWLIFLQWAIALLR